MLGGGARDARRTELYLDGLMEAEERGAEDAPMDLDLDPAVLFAARELRADLVRAHPSFRFEEGLAARLALTAGRMRMAGGRPAPSPGSATIASFADRRFAADAASRNALGATATAPLGRTAGRLTFSRRPSRPLVVGGVGVGVASAAISIGAVYVAWRWSRGSKTPMVRAVHAARSGSGGHASGHVRRAGVLHGILGVMS
jgi:hypothetical protein